MVEDTVQNGRKLIMVQPFYAWPHGPEEENRAAVLAQILKASFAQSGTKIKDEMAILSAARHIVQSDRVTVALKV